MSRKRFFAWAGAVLLFVLLGALALWQGYRSFKAQDPLLTVAQSCAAGRAIVKVLPIKCVSANRGDNLAIVRSVFGRYDYLAVPTIRITGIEDPRLRDPALPNYWGLAWIAALQDLPPGATRNPSNIGLAINSAEARSDNQLHIHISCIKPVIRQLLAANQKRIGTSWSPPFLQFRAETFRVLRVDRPTLDRDNPFFLLFRHPGAARDMGLHTLVVTGAMWSGSRRGFYILDDFAHLSNGISDVGHGESLLDKGCRNPAAGVTFFPRRTH
jgi:CDP-diacylglycerol pyrophosphatase